MQAIQQRLDLLQSKLTKLVLKMDEQDNAYEILKNENNRLKTLLSEKEEELSQWKSKVDSVIESSHIEENRQIIKAQIEEYVQDIDECITLINAM